MGKWLNIRSGTFVVALLLVLSAGAAYALTELVLKEVGGSVTVNLKVPDGIQVYSDGALTQPVDSLDFGEIKVNVFGKVLQPTRIPVWVENQSNSVVGLRLGDDFASGEVLFGFGGGPVKPSPEHAIELEPGQVVAGEVGLRVFEGVDGAHKFTVFFIATRPLLNRPDLVVTSMGIHLETGGGCYTSTQLGIRVWIGNIGSADAGPFVVDVNGVQRTVASGLAAGRSVSLWFAGYGGENTAFVDATFQVQESDEANNQSSSLPLPVPTLPAPCTPTPAPAPPEAEFIISNLSSTPRTVAAGNVVEITADVTNSGGAAGEFSVDLSVDGDTSPRTGRLTPDDTVPIVRFIRIAEATQSGLYSVEANGEKDFFRVVRPLISAAVPTKFTFNPFTTTTRDVRGNPLTIIPGQRIVFGEGPIKLTVPVLVDPGVEVASFVDTTSGISITGRDVLVPVKDPQTGKSAGVSLVGKLKTLLSGTAEGAGADFESLNLITEERGEDLSADDPNVGILGASLNAALERLPEGASVDVTVKKELKAEDRIKVELLARNGGKIVANEAGTVTVQAPAFRPGDVSEVEITLKVSGRWIFEFGTRNVRIAHVSADGTVELLILVCSGPDQKFDFTCVGTREGGFSEFSLVAVADIPALIAASNLRATPGAVAPGHAVRVSLDVTNEGARLGSFSAILSLREPASPGFEAVNVKELTLQSGEQGTINFFLQKDFQGRYEVEVEGLRTAFDVFREISPFNLSFSDVAFSATEVEVGDTVRISMFVENLGDQSGLTEIALRVNGAVSQIQSVVIPGRSKVEVIFDFVPTAEGTFRIDLLEVTEPFPPLSGTVTATIALTPVRILFSRLDVSPLQVDPGQEMTVNVLLTNVGEVAGVTTVAVEIDGVVVASRDVTVDELSAVPVTFTINAPDEPGGYTLSVGRLTQDLEVIAPAVTPVPPTPSSPDSFRPEIEAVPLFVPPGGKLAVVGAGFDPGEVVLLQISIGGGSPSIVLQGGFANDSGAFLASYPNLPASMEPGAYTIRASTHDEGVGATTPLIVQERTDLPVAG